MPGATCVIYEIEDEVGESGLREGAVEALGAERRTVESLTQARMDVKFVKEFQSRPDVVSAVVILDLMFHDTEDSAEGIRFIRDLRAGSLTFDRRIPILVHSNAGGVATREEALRAGATGFFRKNLDPSPFSDALKFYTGHEVLESSVLCDVVRVDAVNRQGVVRIRGRNGWLAERQFPLEFFPGGEPIEGGACFLETIKRFRNYSTEFLLRARGATPQHEDEQLHRWLEGDEFNRH